MRTTQKNSRIPVIPRGKLDLIINATTTDCDNEAEQQTGWFTAIEQNLAVPFETSILGVPVTVAGIDIDECDVVVAICTRNRQTIPILDLPLPNPRPKGAEWIDAYGQWLKGR